MTIMYRWDGVRVKSFQPLGSEQTFLELYKFVLVLFFELSFTVTYFNQTY